MGELQEASDKFFTEALDKGGTCPCCNRYGKVYKRPFHSGLALSILWLVQEYRKTWDYIDVPEAAPKQITKTREFDKLEIWGLATRKKNEDSKKRESGLWAPTQQGADFVDGKMTVFEKAQMYNMRKMKEALGFEGKQITIVQALGDDFDYEELMAGQWRN
jgi:hypothetical protein